MSTPSRYIRQRARFGTVSGASGLKNVWQACLLVTALPALLGLVACRSTSQRQVRPSAPLDVAEGASARSGDSDATPTARFAQGYAKRPLSFEENRGQAADPVRFLARGSGYAFLLTPTEAVLNLWKPATREARGASLGNDGPGEQREPTISAVVRQKLVGAAPAPRVEGLDRLPGVNSYFIGNDPSRWQTRIPTYARVRYRDVYPGIDLVYHGNQQQLEYDFVVAPGVDPGSVRLAFDGVEGVRVDPEGDLVLRTGAGELRQHKPVAYQEASGTRQPVVARYVLDGEGRVGFEVARYDATRPLVIDPTLSFATFLGGSLGDVANKTVVKGGSLYVGSSSLSCDFPIIEQGPGPFPVVFCFREQFVCVTKLDATGSTAIYSDCLIPFGDIFTGDGSGDTSLGGLAVDDMGNAYIGGYTFSDFFPVTANAFQTDHGGCVPRLIQGIFDICQRPRGFVTKLNPSGTDLVYSTYLRGNELISDNEIRAIAVDAAGKAWVTGRSLHNFPVTPGGFQQAESSFLRTDATVTLLDETGSALAYSTYLGGGDDDYGNGITVDAAGNAYVTGTTLSIDFPTVNAFQTTKSGSTFNAFVAKIDPTQTGADSLRYSTYLGGTGVDNNNFPIECNGGDVGYGIALDAGGHVYVTGCTDSVDFPITPDAFAQGFVVPGRTVGNVSHNPGYLAKLDTSAVGAASLLYSTYIPVIAYAVGVDPSARAYVTGRPPSGPQEEVPVTSDAFLTSGEGLLLQLDPAVPGARGLRYATFLSPFQQFDFVPLNVAVDILGNAYVSGRTGPGFPTTPGAFQPTFGGSFIDGFVMKVGDAMLMPRAGAVSLQLGAVTVSFGGVTAGGPLTGIPVDPGAAGTLPARYVILDDLAFDLATTATVTPPITVCVTVPSVNDPALFATLRILHNEGGTLIDRTILAPDTPAPDFSSKTLCANVPSLSPFVVTQLSNQPPVARCKNITVSAGSSTCTATITARDVDNGSSDPDGDPIAFAVDSTGPFGLGSHPVTLTVTDSFRATDSCTATVTVVDTTAPVVTCAVATPVLWQPFPPDHNLVNVGLQSTATDACAGPRAVTVGVFGNEDDQTPTERTKTVFSPDAKNIAPGTLLVRDERIDTGKGRVYLIGAKAVDPAGNTGVACCSAGVPHDTTTKSITTVQQLAQAAQSFCAAHLGVPPAGYFVIGDGPVIGPKQ
jgi:hypothetical protein